MRTRFSKSDSFLSSIGFVISFLFSYIYVLISCWIVASIIKVHFENIYLNTFFFCVVGLFILYASYGLYFLPYIFVRKKKTILKKAIRIYKAFEMLNKSLDEDKIYAADLYQLDFYSTKDIFQDCVQENLRCTLYKPIPNIFNYKSNQKKIFGKDTFWCDLEQVESIVSREESFWANKSNNALKKLQLENEALSEKYKSLSLLHEKTSRESTEFQKRILEFEARISEYENSISALEESNKMLLKDSKELQKMKNDESCYEKLIPLAVKSAVELTLERNSKEYTNAMIEKKVTAKAKELNIEKVKVKFYDAFKPCLPEGFCNTGGSPKQGK